MSKEGPRFQKETVIKQVDVAILDFSKAFDTLHRKYNLLIGKIEQFDITDDVHSWISPLLTGCKQSVVWSINGKRSEEADVKCRTDMIFLGGW